MNSTWERSVTDHTYSQSVTSLNRAATSVLRMALTRQQIDQELGSSTEGQPNYERGTKPLYDDLEYIEIILEIGDYDYHLSLLETDSAHFTAIGGSEISGKQYMMWEHRYRRWWDIAKGLVNFIKTVEEKYQKRE